MPSPGSDSAADFAAFMQAHQDRVYATAVRILGDAAQAEDVAQTVFLKAFERFAELRDHPTASAWLKTVAMHLCINHLQRYRRRFSFFGSWQHDADDERDDPGLPELAVPDELLEGVTGAQRQALVEAALRALPAHQRVPLVLFHFEELTYQQIAEQLYVSVSKVKTDIFRARAALLRHLVSRPATSDLAAG